MTDTPHPEGLEAAALAHANADRDEFDSQEDFEQWLNFFLYNTENGRKLWQALTAYLQEAGDGCVYLIWGLGVDERELVCVASEERVNERLGQLRGHYQPDRFSRFVPEKVLVNHIFAQTDVAALATLPTPGGTG